MNTRHLPTLILIILFVIIMAVVLSCRTTYQVTEHRHLDHGRYYYRLNDSIDMISRDRGMGRHRCKETVRLRPEGVRKCK